MFISPAYASVENAHHSGNIFQDPTFWVAFAFLLTVLLLLATAKKAIVEALNNRTKNIIEKLEETKKLSDDAEKLMLELKSKKENFETTMKNELEKVAKQAEQTRQKNEENVLISMKNKKLCLENQLSDSLNNAISDVTNKAINVSVETCRLMIKDKLKKEDHQSLIKNSVNLLKV